MVKFPHSIRSDKTLIKVDCKKLSMYIVILRKTLKLIQREIFKISICKLKWNNKYSSNTEEGGNEERECKTKGMKKTKINK